MQYLKKHKYHRVWKPLGMLGEQLLWGGMLQNKQVFFDCYHFLLFLCFFKIFSLKILLTQASQVKSKNYLKHIKIYSSNHLKIFVQRKILEHLHYYMYSKIIHTVIVKNLCVFFKCFKCLIINCFNPQQVYVPAICTI